MKTTIFFFFQILCFSLFSQGGKAPVASPDSIKKLFVIPKIAWQGINYKMMASGEDSMTVANYDFGKVKIGDSLYKDFYIKNTGKAPLIITNVVSSCECTVAYFSADAIPPNEVGVIQGGFRVKEEGKIHHTLTVLTNAPNGTDFLEMYAEGVKELPPLSTKKKKVRNKKKQK